MTGEVIDLALRSAGVLATLLATVVALAIAVQGRRAAARQVRLSFELATARRLVEVLAQVRGPLVPRNLEGWSELPALAAALGERRVPLLWHGLFDDPPPSRRDAVVARVITTEESYRAERLWLAEGTLVLKALAAEQRANERAWRPFRR